MNFLELTLSNILFSYKGELVRRQYALGVLVNYLIVFAGFVAAGYLNPINKYASIAIMIFVVILSTYSFTVIMLKRLRNIGAKWFWIFLAIVPYVGFIFIFALMFIKPKDTSKEDAHRREVEKIVEEGMAEEEKCDVAAINK